MNQLKNLPQLKQDELQKITTTIREKCSDVEKIILFGSYARGDYKEEKDFNPRATSGNTISDYDILVVTTTKEVALDDVLWDKISGICKNLKTSAIPRMVVHDIEALNAKLFKAQYFFSDIRKEGIVLYDSQRFELAEAGDLTPSERKIIAQEYFTSWFKRAEDFFDVYKYCSNVGDKNGIAAFHLHQASESAYKAILLVFSNYVPNEHFLEILGEQAEIYCSLLNNILARQTPNEKYRFKLLDYAYIGGRYDPDFRVFPSELDALAIDVRKLLDLTKRICEEKIASFV